MKPTKRLLIVLFLLSLSSFAQSNDTFDIASFQIPPGWTKQVKEGSVLLSTSDTKKRHVCTDHDVPEQ